MLLHLQTAVLLAATIELAGFCAADFIDQQIQAECMICDTQAIAAVTTYQSHFGSFATASEAASHHCSIFENIWRCYTDCINGTSYVYNSETKELFNQMYLDNCDLVCRTAVLPWCYLETVGAYDIAKGCNGSTLNSNLDACVKAELFTKQNCSWSCTRGQRKAMFLLFQVTLECLIPRDREYECYKAAVDCSENVFGVEGSAFIGYSNQTLMESNRLACSTFGDNYVRCIQRAFSGVDYILGPDPADNDTLSPPCAGLLDQVQYLKLYSRSQLLRPICKAPTKSFMDICRGYTVYSIPFLAATPSIIDPNISSDRATIATTDVPTLPTADWLTSSTTDSPTSSLTDSRTSPKTSTTSQSTVRDSDWEASSVITNKPFSAATAGNINGVTALRSLRCIMESATFAVCAAWLIHAFIK